MNAIFLVMALVFGRQAVDRDSEGVGVDYAGVVKEKRCVLFVRRFCPFSIKARNLLQDRGVDCEVFEVDHDARAHDFAKENQSTFPVFFFEGELVPGGYARLKELSGKSLPPFDMSAPQPWAEREGLWPTPAILKV